MAPAVHHLQGDQLTSYFIVKIMIALFIVIFETHIDFPLPTSKVPLDLILLLFTPK